MQNTEPDELLTSYVVVLVTKALLPVEI